MQKTPCVHQLESSWADLTPTGVRTGLLCSDYQLQNLPTNTFPARVGKHTQPFPVHMCTHHTDAHTESLGFIFWAKRGGVVWAGVGVARAGGERTWSRAWSQGADERGFTIRHDCILFIFSPTLPTRRGTDRQTEKKRRRQVGNTQLMQAFFVFFLLPWAHQDEVNVFPSPVSLVYVFFSLFHSRSPSAHPPAPNSRSPEVRTSHNSTWPRLQLFICVNAPDRRCKKDCTKTSGPTGREKARQDRMWKEAGERRETRSTSHNTICTNPKPSALWRVEGLSLHQCSRGWLNTRENLRSDILFTLLMDISQTLYNMEGASGALNLHFL